MYFQTKYKSFILNITIILICMSIEYFHELYGVVHLCSDLSGIPWVRFPIRIRPDASAAAGYQPIDEAAF